MRGHVHGWYFGLRPCHRRRSGWCDDCRYGPCGLPCRLFRQCGGRCGCHRHSDSTFGGLHCVFGAGARRFRTRAVCSRYVPRRAGGLGPHHPCSVAGPPPQDGAARIQPAAPAVLAKPQRSCLGSGGTSADFGWYAPRLVHPDRSRRGGCVLWPVCRHGGAPHHQSA